MPILDLIFRGLLGTSLLLSPFLLVYAADEQTYGSELEGFFYPYSVQQFHFNSQDIKLHMAYMDVKPSEPNGQTVVLMHGKNFCSATWASSIEVLAKSGYRVVALDQIGFCKSSKPTHYQYTFQQLATNTQALLDSIGVNKAIIMGHSTGGMLAVRFGLMYPQHTEQMVLVNPIGLEDWKAMGVPYQSVDECYERELNTTADKIRAYEKSTYYVNEWKPEYERWVQMLAGMYRGPGKPIVAWNSALIYDMIYTQPVMYEFTLLKMPVLLLIGTKDTTAIGKDLAPTEIRAKLGNYDELGKQAAKAIPDATLIEFNDLGHAPQIQNPAVFHAALLKSLKIK